MQTLGGGDSQLVWDEVILNRRVNLDDIPSLSPDIQVQNLAILCLIVPQEGPGAELHDVTPILKGSPELGRIDGQLQRLVSSGANVDVGILGHWRTNSGNAETKNVSEKS